MGSPMVKSSDPPCDQPRATCTCGLDPLPLQPRAACTHGLDPLQPRATCTRGLDPLQPRATCTRGLDPLQGLRGLAALHVMFFHFYMDMDEGR